jgi:hypothetical protein
MTAADGTVTAGITATTVGTTDTTGTTTGTTGAIDLESVRKGPALPAPIQRTGPNECPR